MRLPLLILHISAGIVGILSGTAAMIYRKGSRRHAQSGNVFVIAMMTMAASAIPLAIMKHQPNNVGGGILTLYMISTAWFTARRRNSGSNIFDWVGFLVAFAIGALSLAHAYAVITGKMAMEAGVLPGMDIFMGSIMLLAAAGDLRMILRGVSGVQRISRHLWRMCFGLFIASGSFFLGQGTRVFPLWLQQSNVLMIPAILPLVLLIFWMVRVRYTSVYKRIQVLSGSNL